MSMFWIMALTFVASLAITVWIRVGTGRALRNTGRADVALFAMALATAIQGWGESNASKPAVDVAVGCYLVGLVGMAYLVSGEVRGPEGPDKESK